MTWQLSGLTFIVTLTLTLILGLTSCSDKNLNGQLNIALVLHKIDVVILLIKNGANINAMGIYGYTPLHLIENGVDIHAKIEFGKTAYDLATDKKIKALLKEAMEKQKGEKAD